MRSLELLDRGSAADFVAALKTEVLAHPAVHHEYLQRFANRDFPDMAGAIRDYAYQYHFYSELFTASLEAVIVQLDNPDHQALLRENLEEELGQPVAAGDPPMSHAEMFAKFRRDVGVTEAFETQNSPCATVVIWRQLFLQKCKTPDPGVGVGGIGLGTELIVSAIYTHLLEGLRGHGSLSEEQLIFFPLHIDCDDGHAEALLQVAADLADQPKFRESLRFGAISALNLRAAFWDVMLGRALAMAA